MTTQPMVRTALAVLTSIFSLAAMAEMPKRIDVPSGDLRAALDLISKQAGVELLFDENQLKGMRTQGVSGTLTSEQAVRKLIEGTNLELRTDASTGAMMLAKQRSIGALASSHTVDKADMALAQVTPSGESTVSSATMQTAAADASSSENDLPRGIPEILVEGSRSVNADIQRTEDDAQPYAVFDRAQIARSMATTTEEFLKTRLTMNTQERSNIQGVSLGPASSINLRGLGTNQTLILVDGRRLPSVTSSGSPSQPDINGIPLSAIERIEVLPATASGIYGGSATGGVVNIITRKDYAGFDVSGEYGSSFRGDADNYRVDLSSGFSVAHTRVLVSASLAESDPLLEADRIDWAREARQRQLANNPNAFYTFGASNFPPLGHTTNIRSQNGSNLQLRPEYGGTPLNSPFTHVPVGYAGISSDNAAGLVSNAGHYNLDIPNDLSGAQRSMVAGRNVSSAMLNLRRGFGDRVEGFLDSSWFENQGEAIFAQPTSTVTLPVGAPNNPFTTPINVSFPATGLQPYRAEASTETLRATAGAIVRLGGDWTLATDYTWARVRGESSRTSPLMGDPDGPGGPGLSITDALRNGSLDVMRDLNALPLDWSRYLFPTSNQRQLDDNTLNNASVRVSGPIYELPAGKLRLSSLVEWREEETSEVIADRTNANGTFSVFTSPRRSQSVTSYYLEGLVPLISQHNGFALARELELQASVRRDSYRTRSPSPGPTTLPQGAAPPTYTYFTNEVSATKYTVGLRFQPLQDVTLRASVGTGFLPPAINQIVPNAASTIPAGAVTLTDPKRGGVPSTVGAYMSQSGGNPDLVPEESQSASFGFIFTPRFVDGLRLSLDYTRLEKDNEIQALSEQQILDLEDLLPGRVTRAPLSQADAGRGYTGGVIQLINRTSVNVTKTRLEAYDLQLDQTVDTGGFGRFQFYSVVTYQPHLERQALPGSAFIDSVGYRAGAALEWRGNAGLTWERGPWSAGWNAQYFDDSNVCRANQPVTSCADTVMSQGGSTKIESETYHDAFVGYRFADSSSAAWDGLELKLGIQNVFDHKPAFVATTGITQADYGTFFGDPRLRRFSVNIHKSF